MLSNVEILTEINYKIDILEVMSSTNLNSFVDIDLVLSQKSLIYKKAKIIVNLKDKRLIYENKKEDKKKNKDEKVS